MLEVSPAATEQIASYFTNREPEPIRIFLNEGGWGGPSLSMVMDQERPSDESYNIGDFTFLVDREFMAKVKPIKVDFKDVGFSISANIDLSQMGDGGCSGCGSTSSCCS